MTSKEGQENIVTKKIEAWSILNMLLKEEDMILFNKVLDERQKEQEYTKAFHAKGKYNSNESCLWL